MASKPTSISSPSSLTIRKLLNIQLHKNKLPTSIWPQNKKPQQNAKPNPPIVNVLVSFIHSPPHLSQILTQFFVSGLHHDPFIAGHFIKQLSSSLSPRFAVSLFSLLPNPDAFTINTIIRSFIFESRFDDALAFYRDSVVPASITLNNFSYPVLAKLFSNLGLVQNGILLHAQIVKLGFEGDLYVRNSIIHMYSCFGDVGSAWILFEGNAEESDLVTWNSMMNGCVKNGMVEAARELFDEMCERDLVSWNIMIAGHASVGEMEKAEELFLMMPKRDSVTYNSMIDGYAKNANIALARKFFDSMPKKNVVSWNVILALYARVKDYRECLKLFDAMGAVGEVKPNEATFVSVLTACANLGDLERGKWVHCLVNGIEEADVLLSTALLTMYAKCGAMDNAKEVFDQMEDKSLVTWNSMIMGYGLHGFGDKAIDLFLEMERNGIQPNDKTFVCVLSACVHGGLVVEGWWFFERMVRVYKVEPKAEHVGCMVDLLGRGGLLKDSEELVKGEKGEPSKALWGALMSASRAHSDWNLGQIVGKKMIEMEPSDVGAYVLLSNIYAAQGRWDEVEKVRKLMKDNGVKKDVGVSLVGGRKAYVLLSNIYAAQGRWDEVEKVRKLMKDNGVKKDVGVSLVGGRKFAVEELEGNGSSNGKKRMVYSMPSEMGSHLKLANVRG